jgi:signal transduction histidine kinase
MALLEHPVGIAYFALLSAATLLFSHQTVVHLLLFRTRGQRRYADYAVLCGMSALYAATNICGFLPLRPKVVIAILQLEWAGAIVVAAAYIRAIGAYLDSDNPWVVRLPRFVLALAAVPALACALYLATDVLVFYSPQPRPNGNIIWNATGNLVSHNAFTHAYAVVIVLGMLSTVWLLLHEALKQPVRDRWLIVGIGLTALSAIAEPAVGTFGFKYAVPTFFLANVVEIVRITYVSLFEAGSEMALLERQRKEQERTIAQQMALLDEPKRMLKLGEMSSGIGHEMRAPLASAHSWVQLAQERVERRADPGDALERARSALEHLAHLVTGFGTLVRPRDRDTPQVVVVDRAVRQAIDLCGHELKATECDVQLRVHPAAQVSMRPTDLAQVLVNLITNACDAIRELDDRWVRFEAEREGPFVRIAVVDSGPPPRASVGTRIFRPFFTTKEGGEGTGIGLSISRQIVEGYGGTLELAQGAPTTTLTCRLPAPPASAGAATAPPQ